MSLIGKTDRLMQSLYELQSSIDAMIVLGGEGETMETGPDALLVSYFKLL